MGLEDIQVAAIEDVSDAHTHPGLLAAVLVICDAGLERDVDKRTVVTILI